MADITCHPENASSVPVAFDMKRGRHVTNAPVSPVIAVALLWAVLLPLYCLTLQRGSHGGSLRLVPVSDSEEIHRGLHAALDAMVGAARAVVELAPPSGAASSGKEAVTAADLRSHALLTARLARSSLIPVISEEGVDGTAIPLLSPDSALLMYIDPLDATQEYTERLTQYVTIASCITRCGHPVAGIVTFPFTGRTYIGVGSGGGGFFATFDSLDAAVEGAAARLSVNALALALGTKDCSWPRPDGGGNSVAPVAAADAGPIRVIATRSHFRNLTRPDGWRNMHETIERLRTRRPGSTLLRAGGAGYKLVEVVEGRADLYLHEGPIRKWDVCAGEALLRASGGRITDYQGAEHAYVVPQAWWQMPEQAVPPDAATSGGVGTEKRKAVAKTAFATTGIVASRNPALVAETLAVAARREEL